jgi:hypothetical protein
LEGLLCQAPLGWPKILVILPITGISAVFVWFLVFLLVVTLLLDGCTARTTPTPSFPTGHTTSLLTGTTTPVARHLPNKRKGISLQ